MIKELVDLFKEWGSERGKQRAQDVAMLEQVSSELMTLAAFWSRIATTVETDRNEEPILRGMLRDQRSHYEAILIFREQLVVRAPSDIATRLVTIIDSAIGGKCVLYAMTCQMLGDDLREQKVLVQTQPDIPPDKKIAFIRANREAELAANPILDRDRKNHIIHELRDGAEELSALSGKFRAAVSVFKAEVPFF